MGLPAIRLHDLRHTHASLALAEGVEMKVVSERLGHSQTSVTADLYTHVSRGVGQAAADQIAGVLRGRRETLPATSLQREAAATRAACDEGEERARPRRRFRRSGASSSVSTQSAPEGVLVQDIPDRCLTTCRSDVSRDPGIHRAGC
jgi:hypothetical protein